MHLPISYVNNEGETRRFTCGTVVYSDCFEHGIYFFPQHLFPKCLITNMFGWSFSALNPQMRSVAALLLSSQLTQLLWRAVVSGPDSWKLQ